MLRCIFLSRNLQKSEALRAGKTILNQLVAFNLFALLFFFFPKDSIALNLVLRELANGIRIVHQKSATHAWCIVDLFSTLVVGDENQKQVGLPIVMEGIWRSKALKSEKTFHILNRLESLAAE